MSSTSNSLASSACPPPMPEAATIGAPVDLSASQMKAVTTPTSTSVQAILPAKASVWDLELPELLKLATAESKDTSRPFIASKADACCLLANNISKLSPIEITMLLNCVSSASSKQISGLHPHLVTAAIEGFAENTKPYDQHPMEVLVMAKAAFRYDCVTPTFLKSLGHHILTHRDEFNAPGLISLLGVSLSREFDKNSYNGGDVVQKGAGDLQPKPSFLGVRGYITLSPQERCLAQIASVVVQKRQELLGNGDDISVADQSILHEFMSSLPLESDRLFADVVGIVLGSIPQGLRTLSQDEKKRMATFFRLAEVKSEKVAEKLAVGLIKEVDRYIQAQSSGTTESKALALQGAIEFYAEMSAIGSLPEGACRAFWISISNCLSRGEIGGTLAVQLLESVSSQPHIRTDASITQALDKVGWMPRQESGSSTRRVWGLRGHLLGRTVESLCDVVEACPGELSFEAASKCIEALAELNFYHEPLLQKATNDYHAAIKARPDERSSDRLSRLLQLCAKLNFYKPELMQSIYTELNARPQNLGETEWVRIYWATAVFNRPSKSILSTARQYLHSHFQEFNGQSLINTIWAAAVFARPGDRSLATRALSQISKEVRMEMTAFEYKKMYSAVRALRLPIPSWLQATASIASRPGQISYEKKSTQLEKKVGAWLLKLGYLTEPVETRDGRRKEHIIDDYSVDFLVSAPTSVPGEFIKVVVEADGGPFHNVGRVDDGKALGEHVLKERVIRINNFPIVHIASAELSGVPDSGLGELIQGKIQTVVKAYLEERDGTASKTEPQDASSDKD